MATQIAQIQLRRDTVANWTAQNTILASGEPGYETDTGRFKIGDGLTPWTALSYATVPPSNLATLAPLASPSFTGTPTAPTPTTGDNSSNIATTAFVASTLVSLPGVAPLNSPNFTGTPTAPTQGTNDSSTNLATTAYVKANLAQTVSATGALAGQVPVATGSNTAAFRNPYAIDPMDPPYNAKFDWSANVGNMTSGSNVITVSAAAPAPAQSNFSVGQQVIFTKAGNAGGTASLVGYVSSVGTDGTHVLVSLVTTQGGSTPQNALSTQSGVQFAWGSDDTVALNAAFAAAAARGGQNYVQLPAGWARASQLVIPSGITVRSAGWGSGWGVHSALISGSDYGAYTSTLGTLLQQLEGQTTDFIVFTPSNLDNTATPTVGFLGPNDIELGVVEGPYTTTGTQNGISLRTDDVTQYGTTSHTTKLSLRPQDGFRLRNTHVVGFPGNGFNFPQGCVPLHGFRENRAFFNGGYGFAFSAYTSAFVASEACHVENFSGDGNFSGLMLFYGVGSGQMVRVTQAKAESNSPALQNTNGGITRAHEWTYGGGVSPVVGQLSPITIDHSLGHFLIELNSNQGGKNGASSTYYAGPQITIQDSLSVGYLPTVEYRTIVQAVVSGSASFGSTPAPCAINDTVSGVTVPLTTGSGGYTASGIYPAYSSAFNYATATVPATTQTASYTLKKSDMGSVIEFNSSSGVTLSIPTASSAGFTVGSFLEVFQYGAGQVTISPSGSVTLLSDGSKTHTNAQYSTVGLRMRAVDSWVLTGDLS